MMMMQMITIIIVIVGIKDYDNGGKWASEG